MPTREDLARKYAARIRAAVVRQKIASVNESAGQGLFSSEVREVLAAIDGLTFEDSGRPVDAATHDAIYRDIDRELGVRAGSLRMIKEGSVASALAYERYVAALLTALEAQRG